MRLTGILNKWNYDSAGGGSPWKSVCISCSSWKRKPWDRVFIPRPGRGKGRGPQSPEKKPMKHFWITTCLLEYARWTNAVRSKIRTQANRPHPHLRLGHHVSPGKPAPPLPANQCVTNSLTPSPPTMEVFRAKDSFSWLSWPFAHGRGWHGAGQLASGHPDAGLLGSCHHFFCHHSLSFLSRLSHQNLAVINFACMLITLLICNSLLCQQDQPGFSL